MTGRPAEQLRPLLMVAFHFPPLAGSSGIQRTLRFAQQLPEFGWRPLVLSANPMAYERTSDDLSAEVGPDVIVRRAFALDTARHLAVGGRYIGALARPDRWMTWRFDAVRQGMRLIEEFKPVAIWSTYPIATAHVIAADLHRRSGLPWIADFRDPMAQEGYPADPRTWRAYRDIETRALSAAVISTFTTPGAAAEYRQRYPAGTARIRVLENGYDEESFAGARDAAAQGSLTPGALTLLHSGIVYPSERDPTQLIQALGQLHRSGHVTPDHLRIRFRAAVSEGLLRDLALTCGVSEYLEILPPVGYREALAEMMRADGLLVMQASNCNAQIPAKLYEYLRAGRPILCLTDPIGDTAGVLRDVGIATIAKLDDAADISRLLSQFVRSGGNLPGSMPRPECVTLASRRNRTAQLAGWLDEVTGRR